MKVHAPNKNYTGVSASVAFCNGVGETEDPHLLEWFKSHGYEVQENEASEAPEREKKAPGKKAGE